MPRGLCDTLIIPGGGMDAEGNPTLRTRRRAEVAAGYYHKRLGNMARIVCAGGYPARLAEPPVNGATESQWVASYLKRAGVRPDIITTETSSTSTFGNFIEIQREGLLGGLVIDRDNPVGVVTNRLHYARARLLALKVFGLDPSAVRSVLCTGEVEGYMAARDVAQEAAAFALTAAVLANTAPGDAAGVFAAYEQFTAVMGRGALPNEAM